MTPNQTTEKKKVRNSPGWTSSSEKRSDEFKSPERSRRPTELSPQEADLPRVRGAIETESGRSDYIIGTIDEDAGNPSRRVMSHDRVRRSPLSEGACFSEEKPSPEFNSPFDDVQRQANIYHSFGEGEIPPYQRPNHEDLNQR